LSSLAGVLPLFAAIFAVFATSREVFAAIFVVFAGFWGAFAAQEAFLPGRKAAKAMTYPKIA